MRLFVLFVLVAHSLIHFLGFIKANHLFKLPQLKLEISKTWGFVWLLVGLACIGIAVLVLVNKQWWWLPAIFLIIISQILIISVWEDAKAGTVANILILIFAVFAYGHWDFQKETKQDINLLLSKVNRTATSNISEKKLQPLPDNVQTWLIQTGVVGKKQIQYVSLKQKGLMKLKPEQKNWSTASAEQVILANYPEFVWNVDMKMFPMVHALGRDSLIDGRAHMQIKLGSLIPVVNVSDNAKSNQSSLQRYLLELPWYPTAALNPSIKWESVNQTTAKATLTYKGVTGSAFFHFDGKGDLLKVTAMRYKENDKYAKLIKCIGEVKEFSLINNMKIPTKMNVSWMLGEKKFTWYKLSIYDVTYN